MPRPVMLGIVGDSGSGKTTITRGLVRVLGEDQVTHFCTDDYHRYDRRQRAERNITPLDPECNHLDILEQHLAHLRRKEPIMKPVYQHSDGTFGPPDYFEPGRVRRLRGPARLPHRRDCARASTCASTSTLPRSCAGTGRCSATARAAATRPTRCSPSSTGASRTPSAGSGRSATTPTSSSPSSPATTRTRSTSTASSRSATRSPTPT